MPGNRWCAGTCQERRPERLDIGKREGRNKEKDGNERGKRVRKGNRRREKERKSKKGKQGKWIRAAKQGNGKSKEEGSKRRE